MKANPASCRSFRFAAESIPASATTTMSVMPCRAWNAASTGIKVLVSSSIALEQVDFQGEPARVDQQPDLHLRVDAMLLGHPDLAQIVLGFVLEMQRCHVVQTQRAKARRRSRNAADRPWLAGHGNPGPGIGPKPETRSAGSGRVRQSHPRPGPPQPCWSARQSGPAPSPGTPHQPTHRTPAAYTRRPEPATAAPRTS